MAAEPTEEGKYSVRSHSSPCEVMCLFTCLLAHRYNVYGLQHADVIATRGAGRVHAAPSATIAVAPRRPHPADTAPAAAAAATTAAAAAHRVFRPVAVIRTFRFAVSTMRHRSRRHAAFMMRRRRAASMTDLRRLAASAAAAASGPSSRRMYNDSSIANHQ